MKRNDTAWVAIDTATGEYLYNCVGTTVLELAGACFFRNKRECVDEISRINKNNHYVNRSWHPVRVGIIERKVKRGK